MVRLAGGDFLGERCINPYLLIGYLKYSYISFLLFTVCINEYFLKIFDPKVPRASKLGMMSFLDP